MEELQQMILKVFGNSPTAEQLSSLDTLDGTESFLVFKPGEKRPYLIQKGKIVFPGEVPDSILDFADTPSSFTGQKGKILVVKQDETGLEYKVLAEVTGVDQATFDLLEDRVSQLEAGGTGGDPTVDHTYPTIPDMIAGQNAQLEDDIIKVLDASGDPNIGAGKAYYFYDGTTAGTLEDYTLLTKEEVTDLSGFADKRLSNLPSDLTEAEKTAIKNKIGAGSAASRTLKEITNTTQYTYVAEDFTSKKLLFNPKDANGNPVAGATINVLLNTGVADVNGAVEQMCVNGTILKFVAGTGATVKPPKDRLLETYGDGAVSGVSLTAAEFYQVYGDLKSTVTAAIPNEEEIRGTATENTAATGTLNQDLNTFVDKYLALTGNTTFTFSNTPASGKAFVRTMTIKSTTTETLALPTGYILLGAYANTGVENYLTFKFSNFPTVGLKVVVTIDQA